MPVPTHKTKIVATLGPACASPEVLKEMILAGMNVARLNFSHGDFEAHRRLMETVRAAARAAGRWSRAADRTAPAAASARNGAHTRRPRAGERSRV